MGSWPTSFLTVTVVQLLGSRALCCLLTEGSAVTALPASPPGSLDEGSTRVRTKMPALFPDREQPSSLTGGPEGAGQGFS